MKLVVLGLGYLGATHAACMAELGHEVLGIEIDARRLEAITNGALPFFEPGLSEMVAKHLSSGKLVVSDSYEKAADWGDVFFVAVGTPQKKGEYAADLTYVDGVIETLVPLLTRDTLILGKSTVPVGTTKRLARRALDLVKSDIQVEIAWNPEFLREGHAIADTLKPDRIVIGSSEGGRAIEVAQSVYHQPLEQGVPLLTMDPASAELVKVAANSFLATKISFINAIAEICGQVGADVGLVANAIGHDDRIGRKFLSAGIGFGGGCLPKDIRAFIARAGELGVSDSLAFLREVDQLNMRRRNRVVKLAEIACEGSLLGKRVAVLGTAFKPNSDDVRDSPALNIAGQIQLQGATVSVYDPKAMQNSAREFPTLSYVPSTEEACRDADLVLVLTEWDEFKELEPNDLAGIVRHTAIIDGRICLDLSEWTASGWSVWR